MMSETDNPFALLTLSDKKVYSSKKIDCSSIFAIFSGKGPRLVEVTVGVNSHFSEHGDHGHKRNISLN